MGGFGILERRRTCRRSLTLNETTSHRRQNQQRRLLLGVWLVCLLLFVVWPPLYVSPLAVLPEVLGF